MYTQEQAEKDKNELERMAIEADIKAGLCQRMAIEATIMAGLCRVEASNCLQRVGRKKCHKPNLGPYSLDNPCRCVDCGKPQDQWAVMDGECVP